MLTKKMSLKAMLDFSPNDEDMAVLDLDTVVYLKLAVISIAKEINYNFIRFIFKEGEKEMASYFKNLAQTVFYDFEYRKGDDNRAITISEFYALKPYTETEMFINELLQKYSHEAEVIFDFYTHDRHIYRLSNLDGIVVNDQLR